MSATNNEVWSFPSPTYDEVYDFVSNQLGCNIMILDNEVIMVCRKNFITEPSFIKYIHIGLYTWIDEIKNHKFHFRIISKSAIQDKLNRFLEDVENERKTLLYKICSFFYFHFKFFPVYQFHGWTFPKINISKA